MKDETTLFLLGWVLTVKCGFNFCGSESEISTSHTIGNQNWVFLCYESEIPDLDFAECVCGGGGELAWELRQQEGA